VRNLIHWLPDPNVKEQQALAINRITHRILNSLLRDQRRQRNAISPIENTYKKSKSKSKKQRSNSNKQ